MSNTDKSSLGKKVFTAIAVLPLIVLLCALNQWWPDLGQFRKIWGIPFSIFAVVTLLLSQVALAWAYLVLFDKEGDSGQ
jgi:steroid 5-alpha reductase family enzyme